MSDEETDTDTEIEIKRPRVPEWQAIYCIETFDGELIAHSRDGALVFPNKDDAFKFMRVLEPSENSMRYTVTEIHVRHRGPKPFTEFGMLCMDDLKMPVGGLWFRDFQDGKEPKRAIGRPPGRPPKAK